MSKSIIGNSSNITITTAKPLADGAHHSQQEEGWPGMEQSNFD